MIKLYNSLTRKLENFIPIHTPKVGMYTCGPTVYSYASIGNFRTYTLSDLLLRVLQNNGFQVTYIMNFTDVGHLSGDNLGDADTGEDRMAQSAAKEHRSMWDIADGYIEAFKGEPYFMLYFLAGLADTKFVKERHNYGRLKSLSGIADAEDFDMDTANNPFVVFDNCDTWHSWLYKLWWSGRRHRARRRGAR